MRASLCTLLAAGLIAGAAWAEKPQPEGAGHIEGRIAGNELRLTVVFPSDRDDAVVEAWGVGGLRVDGAAGPRSTRVLHRAKVKAGETIELAVGFQPGPGRSHIAVSAGGSPVAFEVGEESRAQRDANAQGVTSDDDGRRIKVMHASPPAQAGADLTIELSQSGGVTGGGSGYAIAPDGSVTRWEQAAAGLEKKSAPAGKLDRKTLHRLRRLIDKARFFQLPEGQPDNMTVSLTVRRGGEEHTVRGAELPESVRPLQQAIEAAVRRAGRHAR